MKALTLIEKLFTPLFLVILNIAIIIAAEYVGGGRFFAETGLVHAIAIIFVALIVVRIFSDHGLSYPEIKGFLQVQLGALLLLGLVHVYEYFSIIILKLNSSVVELTVIALYMVWFLCMLLSLDLVSRAYYGGKGVLKWILVTIISLVLVAIVGINVSSSLLGYLPASIAQMMLAFMVALTIMEVSSLAGIQNVLPIFSSFSGYAVPATILLFVSAFFEYIESSGILDVFHISGTQVTYISHFVIYAVLSLLFIAMGKLKNPAIV